MGEEKRRRDQGEIEQEDETGDEAGLLLEHRSAGAEF
jgi:hypothetical protein